MPLNPLTLNVTSGVIGRPFSATIAGLSAGSTLEVGIDGTQGFSTVNGRVFSQALPYAVNTLVLRETLPGDGVRESRIDILADGVAVGASALPGLVAATIPAALAPLPVMPDRRLPYVVAPIGDSRSAATYTDPEARNLSSASPLNWANARLSQRFVVGDGFGKSGDRTDQVLARVPAAIASGAGMMLWQAALNDISQNFPSATTSGATAFANTKNAAEQARASGVIFVAEAEVGADNLTAAQVAQVNEYNALLFEYSERTSGVYVHDARPAVMQSGFGDSQVRYRTNYSYDGVHPNGRGASYWGESLAALLDKIVPPRASPLIQSRTALPANGRRQLLLNPIFATATGGTLQTGVSGTIPANFVSSISAGGSSTATLGTQADAGGMGNNVTADVTFAQASARFQFFQDVNAANYLAGDIVRAVADVEITGTPNNLAALYLQLQHNTGAGGQTYDSFNLFGPVGTGQIGPDKAVRLTLATRPYVIRPTVGAGGYMSTSVRAIAAGSGGCQFIIRQLGLQRRDTAY